MIKNKNAIIGIISTFILIISAVVITSLTTEHSSIKNIITVKSAKNSNKWNLYDAKNITTNNLIRNLTDVEEYIKCSVIERQNILLLSIVGGTLSNTIKYKKSQIAWFNDNTGIKKDRYTKQAKATINNSKTDLTKEDDKIAKIITILKEHPYTYTTYLNNLGYIIPNIDFFLSRNSLNKNKLKQKMNTILNDSYSIKESSTTINSISLASEEQATGLKSISFVGAGVLAVIFKNFTFSSKIITFNQISNKYEFASPTKKIENTKSFTNNVHTQLLRKNNLVISKSIHSNLNNILFFDSNNPVLTRINSLYNKITTQKDTIANSKTIPQYFSTDFVDSRAPDIKSDKITEYKHNKLLYTLMYVIPSILVIIYSIIATTLTAKDIRKNGISLKENVHVKADSNVERKSNRIIRNQKLWKRNIKQKAPTAAQIQEDKEINARNNELQKARNEKIIQNILDTRRKKREVSKNTTDKREPLKTTKPQLVKWNIKTKSWDVDNGGVSEVQNNLQILKDKYLELKWYSEILYKGEGTLDIEEFISTINGYINEMDQLRKTLALNPEIKHDLANDISNWRIWSHMIESELNSDVFKQNHIENNASRRTVPIWVVNEYTSRGQAETYTFKYQLQKVRTTYTDYLSKQYCKGGIWGGSLEDLNAPGINTFNLPYHDIVSADSISARDSDDFGYTYSESEGYTKLAKSKKDETGIESLLIIIEADIEC